ncbi:hypothetical protein BC941DRAFT_472347 [Chlamydoabsidia padenii]|nr:hypothetical protein BC941DRAFT_472347 [Chlamydoabsidia padenii]
MEKSYPSPPSSTSSLENWLHRDDSALEQDHDLIDLTDPEEDLIDLSDSQETEMEIETIDLTHIDWTQSQEPGWNLNYTQKFEHNHLSAYTSINQYMELMVQEKEVYWKRMGLLKENLVPALISVARQMYPQQPPANLYGLAVKKMVRKLVKDSNADMTLRSIWKEMNEQDEWLQGSGPPFSRLGHDEDDILQAIFGIPRLMAWADQIYGLCSDSWKGMAYAQIQESSEGNNYDSE